ncbi:MAG: hypothetical protein C4337_04370 [Armatimonadota bacterium]
MRRFRFRLERVLRYRQSREEVAYRALHDAIRQRVQHEAEITQVREQIRSQARLALSPLDWTRREQTLSALQTRLERLLDTLPLLQEQEAHARQVYLQIRQEREALTRLRQHAYQRFQGEIERALQTETDEVLALAYQRVVPQNPTADSGDSDAP